MVTGNTDSGTVVANESSGAGDRRRDIGGGVAVTLAGLALALLVVGVGIAGAGTAVDTSGASIGDETFEADAAVETPGAVIAAETPEAVDEEVVVRFVDDGSNEGDATATIDLFEDEVPPGYTVEYVDVDTIDDGDIEETDIFVVYNADVFSFSGQDLITTVEDDPTTGAVYLDQHGVSTVAGIPDRIDAVGDPEDFDTDGIGDGPAEYVIEADHPIFDGVGGPEDVVDINTGGEISWFTGASGDTLATIQNQDEDGGPAVAVDPESGSVLLSGIAVGGFVDPGEPTDEAGQILANAVEFAEPEPDEAFFEVTDLDAPAGGAPGETIDVSATITNVGGELGTQDVAFVFDGAEVETEPVELAPDANTTVTFEPTLPDEEGVFEHGVASEDDNQTAPIGVGVELRTVTVVEDETDGAETLGIFDDELPETYIPQVVDIAEVDDGVVTGTDIFVFHDLDGDTGLITDVEDDNETGAVYLDQRGDASNAIPDRETAINDPEATAESNDDDPPVVFEVQAEHPIFDGVADPGETVAVHDDPIFAARAWFGGASGETLAEVGVEGADFTDGAAVAVDPESRSVLLSSIAVSAFTDDPEVYTDEAGQILANAVEFADPGPLFAVSDLSAPASAAPGTAIDVNATVTNIGEESDTQDIEFVFDGEVTATEGNVTLDTGETTAVTFEDITLPEEAGTFTHGVFTDDDGQTADIAVGESLFAVSDLSAPATGEAGETIDVNATVTNTGTLTDTQDVEFVFDGDTVATEPGVELEPDANTTVAFENVTLPEETGTFTHGVFTDDDNQTADITVGASVFAVSDLSAPAVALAGETIDVTATVTNTGTLADTQDVEFVFDGETVATEPGVELAPGANTTVAFGSVTLPESPGIFEHGVFTEDDNQAAAITVSVDVTGDGNPATDTTGDGLLDDLTGDGQFTIADVQALFENFNSDAVQDNVELFDFLGDDRVTIFDVQALFTDLQSGA